MTENPIDYATAMQIWRVLVEECQARDTDDHRYSFAHYLATDPHGFGHEYRFMGALGFGGKFHNDGYRWFVTCYRENETPERLEMIRKANERLATLRAKAVPGTDASCTGTADDDQNMRQET